MNFEELMNSLWETLRSTIPNLLLALAILVGGWLAALLLRGAARKGLRLIRVDERIRSSTGKDLNIEKGAATGVYVVILLVVLMMFFNALNLEYASASLDSLVKQIVGYLPSLVAGGVLLLVAWIVATVLRTIVAQVLTRTKLDEKVQSEMARPMSETLSNVVYWLVTLLFLPAVLGALRMEALVQPVQTMVNDILSMLPRILVAVAIAVGGWFIARILRDLVTNILKATGIDKLGDKGGLKGTTTLSGLVGLTVYILVLVTALIAALDALKVEAISGPASRMLDVLLTAVPNIFGAAIILTIAYYLAGLVSGLAASLLGGVAFDRLPEKLGLGRAFEKGPTPSELVGKIVFFFFMLFAIVEAANILGFSQVSGIVTTLIEFGGQVLLGIVIIAAGFWIARIAHNAIERVSGENAGGFAEIARFAILLVVFAMGLRAMGLADDIVNLAFGITLGAAAIAAAIAFGMGGREAAARQIDNWVKRLGGS